MSIWLNKLIPKKVKVEKVIDPSAILTEKLWKYDKIIEDYFGGKTNIVKLSTVLKDPDINSIQINAICEWILNIPEGKSSSSLNSLLVGVFSNINLSQNQADSIYEKFNNGNSKSSYLTSTTETSFFDNFHHSIYSNYTLSLSALYNRWNTRRTRIMDNMSSYFSYIRKNQGNSKLKFDEVKDFYKNQILTCQNFDIINSVSIMFPEAFENFDDREKGKLFNNILSKKANQNSIEELTLLENLFSSDSMLKYNPPAIKKYTSRVDSIINDKKNDLSDSQIQSTYTFLWRFLPIEEKMKLIDDYLASPSLKKQSVVKAIARGLSDQELSTNKDLKEKLESFKNFGLIPIQEEKIFNITEDNYDELLLSISANKSFYDLNTIADKLKSQSGKSPIIDSFREKLYLLIREEDDGSYISDHIDAFLDLNIIKKDPLILKKIFDECETQEKKPQYDSLYKYYLNWLDITLIRNRFPNFNPPNEANVSVDITWEVDLSSINFEKETFNEDEFKLILTVTDPEKLAFIFWREQMTWKKSLASITNYANFLVALRDNTNLKNLLDGYSHPLNKATIPNIKKYKAELLLALNWNKFDNIQNYPKLLYPIESINVDTTNRLSIVNFLKLIWKYEEDGKINVLNDSEYIKNIFSKLSIEDVVFFIWLRSDDYDLKSTTLNILLEKFITEFDKLPNLLKKSSLDNVINKLNSINESSITFDNAEDKFNWESILAILKLIVLEKSVTPLKFELVMNIDTANKNKVVNEYCKYYTENILLNPIYTEYFKKDLAVGRQSEVPTIIETFSNWLVDKEVLDKIWSKYMDWLNSDNFDNFISDFSNKSKSDAEKTTKSKMQRGENIYDDSATAKLRLQNFADSLKKLPKEKVGKVINYFVASRELNDASTTIKKKVKEYLTVWTGWLAAILQNNWMTINYWKELSKKFEVSYKNKNYTEIKDKFKEFDEVSIDEFVSFFKWYIYPVLTKMSITSVQKAKYLWTILSRDQFKAIIDSVK